MVERQACIRDAEDVRAAIEYDGKRAGFESECARQWGWFILVEKQDTYWWEWVRPCSYAEVLLFQQWFAEEKIYGEPQIMAAGMCVLAA